MFDWIVSLIRTIGYPGIVFLMFLENVFPPLPSEGIMPFAGFVAHQGEMSLGGVIAAGTIGSVLGTLPLYYLGRAIGLERIRDWAERHGRWLTISGEDVDQTARWFERFGPAAVLIGRSLPGARAFVSVPAGAQRMHLGLFLLYNTIGSGIWTAVLTYTGVILGQNYGRVKDYLGPITWVVMGLFTAAFIVRVVRQHADGRAREQRARRADA
jgi:membrane protein DedA with SNARE-associated domain